MRSPSHHPELEQLADRWFGGVASEAECTRLWELVVMNQASASAFVEAARFELLLEDAMHGVLRGKPVEQDVVRQTRRVRTARLIRFAAVIALFAGLFGWLVANREVKNEGVVSNKYAGVKLVEPPPDRPRLLRPPPIWIAPASRAPDQAPKPLRSRLDDFFLPTLELVDTPLAQAIEHLREQLKLFNLQGDKALETWRLTLPASVTSRKVTLVTGPVSFLKALEALAALTGQELQVGDSSIAFVISATPLPLKKTTREMDSFLVGDSLGADDLRSIEHNARMLGLNVDPSNRIEGTPYEFSALESLIAASRQVAALPPSKLLIVPGDVTGGSEDRAFSRPEAQEVLKLAREKGLPVYEVEAKSSGSPVQRSTNETIADYQLSVRPAGSAGGILISVEPTIRVEVDRVAETPQLPPTTFANLVTHPGTGGTLTLTLASTSPEVNGDSLTLSGASQGIGSLRLLNEVSGTENSYLSGKGTITVSVANSIQGESGRTGSLSLNATSGSTVTVNIIAP